MLAPKERKIFCLNNISSVGLEKFRKGYTVTDNIDEAAGILVRSADMKDTNFPEGLRAIARAGAGVNNIPIDRCSEEGIVVFNTPGANANSVKELVIAGLLLAARDIFGGIAWVKSNAAEPEIAKLTEKAKKKFAGHEIQGKTLGVIGLGAIGVRAANAAVALGMNVLGYDPYLSVKSAWMLSPMVKHADSPEEVYSVSDYITIHVPLMESTKKMLSADCVALMKPTAVILNFARDLLVDEEAVVAALAEGKLHRYVTDFANPTTVGKKGVITTPHLGASTEESEDNCAAMAVRELRDFMENGNIVNSVNYPDISMGGCETAERIVILHKNIAGAISKFTTLFGDAGINIANMSNKSKGDYAVTLIDNDSKSPAETIEVLSQIDFVLRVRAIS